LFFMASPVVPACRPAGHSLDRSVRYSTFLFHARRQVSERKTLRLYLFNFAPFA
jgi:hypothetical protein